MFKKIICAQISIRSRVTDSTLIIPPSSLAYIFGRIFPVKMLGFELGRNICAYTIQLSNNLVTSKKVRNSTLKRSSFQVSKKSGKVITFIISKGLAGN